MTDAAKNEAATPAVAQEEAQQVAAATTAVPVAPEVPGAVAVAADPTPVAPQRVYAPVYQRDHPAHGMHVPQFVYKLWNDIGAVVSHFRARGEHHVQLVTFNHPDDVTVFTPVGDAIVAHDHDGVQRQLRLIMIGAKGEA